MEVTVDYMRLLMNDPSGASDEKLSDPEYDLLIAIEPANLYRCAALCAATIAAQSAEHFKNSQGGVASEPGEVVKHYLDLAKNYNSLANQGLGGSPGSSSGTPGSLEPVLTGTSLSKMREVISDTDRFPSRTRLGMHSNKRVDEGSANLGGSSEA